MTLMAKDSREKINPTMRKGRLCQNESGSDAVVLPTLPSQDCGIKSIFTRGEIYQEVRVVNVPSLVFLSEQFIKAEKVREVIEEAIKDSDYHNIACAVAEKIKKGLGL